VISACRRTAAAAAPSAFHRLCEMYSSEMRWLHSVKNLGHASTLHILEQNQQDVNLQTPKNARLFSNLPAFSR